MIYPVNLFSENWLKSQDRIVYKKVIFIYKSMNKTFQDYMSNLFTKSANTNQAPLKHFAHGSIFLGGISLPWVLWNLIPLHIRQSETLHKFKSAYITWWHSVGTNNLAIMFQLFMLLTNEIACIFFAFDTNVSFSFDKDVFFS